MIKNFKIFVLLLFYIYFASSNQIVLPKLLDNKLITTELIEECISIHRADVILLLETSRFIDKYSFNIMKFFSIKLMNRLNITKNGNHFGFITYSNTTHNILPLQWNKYKIKQSLKSIKFNPTGKPNLGETLKIVKETIFSPFTYRESIPKVIFIVTTGHSFDDITSQIEELQKQNILIYSIGVTKNFNLNNLYILSNNPLRVFYLTIPLSSISHLINSIIWDACKASYRVGAPEVICGKKFIGIRLATKKNFEGSIYVMDHFNNEECKRNADEMRDLRSLSLTIPFNRCNVKRWRSINPRGIYTEVTIIIQYHPLFMSEDDQVIKGRCFYQEEPSNVEFSSNYKIKNN